MDVHFLVRPLYYPLHLRNSHLYDGGCSALYSFLRVALCLSAPKFMDNDTTRLTGSIITDLEKSFQWISYTALGVSGGRWRGSHNVWEQKKGRVEIKKKFCVGCRLRHYQERLDHGTGFFFSSVILSIFKEIVTLNKFLSWSGLNVLIQLVKDAKNKKYLSRYISIGCVH